ncbi:MAG: DEAD/DEAH box helicase [Phycisphaerales bacterium]|nr:DEAD/DEAH box helicase [Phycisphaerales bacterium]
MNTQRFLDHVRSSRDYQGQIVHTHVIPAREARHAEPVAAIEPCLRNALAALGISQFYSHQAAVIDAVSPPARRHAVVVTGTASGKTLCYNVPVINAFLRNPDARAMYLYPTKALAQDQLGALDRLCAADARLSKRVRASTYDGDTPVGKRRSARANANVILTNPDMLHANILPQSAKWARDGFFSNLHYVVIDEVHSYRGTFGSHVAGVLRRLRRICRHYGSDPTFIASSATIANPGQLTARLIGVNEDQLTVVDQDGSPRGRKLFVLWNPPFIDRSELERRSANIEAQRLMRDLILDGAQTIAFARARVVAELIYKYLQDDLKRYAPKLVNRVRAYRGGYLANERRKIEQELFSGSLLGVCSTNALELGIDVGTLDAAIVVGFPGTICSVWQQAGRAGRTRDDSLAVFVAYNDPIDQYFMRHARYFFEQSPEHAAIDPLNRRILASQLQCAAQELPLSGDDDHVFGCSIAAFVDELPDSNGPDSPWHRWPDGRIKYQDKDGYLPHHGINLRLIGNQTFDIIDRTNGESVSIGVVDSISAPELVYPNAVYLHDGQDYLVRDLDFNAKIASVERINADYYTQAVLSDHCRVLETHSDEACGGGRKYVGRLAVTWQTVAFKKIKYYTLEVIGQDGLDLPPQTIDTIGVWATFPESVTRELMVGGFKVVEALVGVRNLLLVTLPMMAMCDRRDISGCVDSSNLGRLALFVYDRYEGGIGYARLGYEHFEELLRACLDLVGSCPCDRGCPSCVGLANVRPPLHSDPDVGPGYAIPNKDATVSALRGWLRR